MKMTEQAAADGDDARDSAELEAARADDDGERVTFDELRRELEK